MSLLKHLKEMINGKKRNEYEMLIRKRKKLQYLKIKCTPYSQFSIDSTDNQDQRVYH
jgi:hypothetical protein